MTRIGTSHFVSRRRAIRYYGHQGLSESDVDRKISDGEIHIGEPTLKHGERLVVIDDGTRYAIED